jgi:hypothetical protein
MIKHFFVGLLHVDPCGYKGTGKEFFLFSMHGDIEESR